MACRGQGWNPASCKSLGSPELARATHANAVSMFLPGDKAMQQRPHADDSSNRNMVVRGYKDREVRPRAQGKDAKTKMGSQLPGALNSLDNTGNQAKPRKVHTECHSQRPLPRGLTQSP